MKELGPIDQTKAGDFQLHSVTEETSKVTNNSGTIQVETSKVTIQKVKQV